MAGAGSNGIEVVGRVVARASQAKTGEHWIEVKASHIEALHREIREMKGQLALAYSVLADLGFEPVEMLDAATSKGVVCVEA